MSLSLLVVDDSPISRMIVIASLPKNDFEIREASDGKEAVELYKQKAADLVLMDLTMPVMDGFEALDHIKKFDPDARVIILSSDIQKESQQKIRELGALDFIPKPPSEEKLKNIFNGIFGS